MPRSLPAFFAAGWLLSVLAFSCAPASSSVGGGGNLDGGTGDGGSNGGGGDGGGGGGGGGSVPTPEVCDGVDNDQNGIIDDVDTAGDGVCDCLKIATVGFRGQWGTGDVFNNWLNGKSTDGAVALGNQTLTAELLAPFQVIVIQDVREGTAGQSGVGKGIGRTFSQAEVNALKAWVENGGGVMTLMGYGSSSEITNVNTLLSAYSMSYSNAAILPKSGGQTVSVTGWETHPLSSGVTKIGVDNGYEVNGGNLIAYEATPGNYDVGRAKDVGQGHVFVWGDEWITYDSEWNTRPDYQLERFWLNSLKWLTPALQCQVPLPVIN